MQLDELSKELLARYKKKAAEQASAADKAGDFEKGNKRFSGIVKATKKQFDKPKTESRLDKDGTPFPELTPESTKLKEDQMNPMDLYLAAIQQGAGVLTTTQEVVESVKAEQELDEAKRPDRFHIVTKDGKPANLTSYATLDAANADRKEKHPGTVIHQVGPKGSVKRVFEEVELDEAIKLNSKVVIHDPGESHHGKVGYVGEIRHGAYKGAPKTYTVDYDHNEETGRSKSIQLDKKNIKQVKEEVELDEAKGALNYTPQHKEWGVVPKSKKEFVTFFPKHKEAEARAHSEKTGGQLVKIDQHGRRLKEEVELDEGLADDLLAVAKKVNPNAKMAGSIADKKKERDAMIAKREKEAAEKPKTAIPPRKDSYPLGGYDPKSHRSYSEETELTLGQLIIQMSEAAKVKGKPVEGHIKNKIELHTGEEDGSRVAEELKGNQHKLDKNKNGKLDAHDFKLLRKEEQELEEGWGSDEQQRKAEESKAGWDKLFDKHKDNPKMVDALKKQRINNVHHKYAEQEAQRTMKEEVELDEGQKIKTSTGYVHKGSYGSDYDTDEEGTEKKKAAPDVKRGRGRPKKGSDETGEVKKYTFHDLLNKLSR